MSFRRFAYNIFFRLSPILIVILLELALRFFGVGNSYILFNESENGQNYILNSQYYLRFVSERQFPDLEILPQEISKEKGDDIYRVFLIGDQSMLSAFPEANQKQIIEDFDLPNGKKINIVQLVAPFSNSFATRRLVSCVNRYDADACVLLSGQNEFYGLPQKSAWMQDMENYFGITSYIRMKNHRYIQILDRFLFLKKEPTSQFPPENPDDWIVSFGSEKYEEIKTYFEKNIKTINKISTCPVFYSILPSNYLTPPYRSDFDDKELMDSDFINEFSVLLASADTFTVNRWINDLNAWEPETAVYYYCKGLIAEHDNNAQDAYVNYTKALDLDAFHVRMDNQFKDVIRTYSDQENIELIDLDQRIQAMENSILDIDRYFSDGIRLNEQGKQLFISEIRSKLTAYFTSINQ